MSFTAFLIDDDAGVLKALSRLLQAAGYDARPYRSPKDFLAEHDPAVPGCVVLDLTMPELDGLELQQALKDKGVERPIIFLSGTADIPTSVRAMKQGAVDFLTKPVDHTQLFAAVDRAIQQDALGRESRESRDEIASRLAQLTPREHQVLCYVITGRLNKQIAAELGTVEKTVKVHRGRMMAKLGVRNLVDLVHLAEKAGIEPIH